MLDDGFIIVEDVVDVEDNTSCEVARSAAMINVKKSVLKKRECVILLVVSKGMKGSKEEDAKHEDFNSREP